MSFAQTLWEFSLVSFASYIQQRIKWMSKMWSRNYNCILRFSVGLQCYCWLEFFTGQMRNIAVLRVWFGTKWNVDGFQMHVYRKLFSSFVTFIGIVIKTIVSQIRICRIQNEKKLNIFDFLLRDCQLKRHKCTSKYQNKCSHARFVFNTVNSRFDVNYLAFNATIISLNWDRLSRMYFDGKWWWSDAQIASS